MHGGLIVVANRDRHESVCTVLRTALLLLPTETDISLCVQY